MGEALAQCDDKIDGVHGQNHAASDCVQACTTQNMFFNYLIINLTSKHVWLRFCVYEVSLRSHSHVTVWSSSSALQYVDKCANYNNDERTIQNMAIT